MGTTSTERVRRWRVEHWEEEYRRRKERDRAENGPRCFYCHKRAREEQERVVVIEDEMVRQKVWYCGNC